MNKTLLLGLIIIIFMLCASLFGKYVAPHDLNESAQVSSNGGELIVPPSPPSKDHPLGTDKYGYDILAKLLAGLKYTIFVSVPVAFSRTAIGRPLVHIAETYLAAFEGKLPDPFRAGNCAHSRLDRAVRDSEHFRRRY
ncbi:oligopeptide transport permease C-like protein [Paenibacillus taihuensis]|uniref:Oligopeptide transport permease C-like protein n=1 Tax=Paenibacillus taihuensis TaxID=1156355 RepID=A0A3D9RTJ1_9BACL|nr:oligopeptide transport permease C-like protein [Paenibacillus taihuensis]